MRKVNKRIPQGGELLIPRRDWVPVKTMTGELNILENPIFETAHNRILELYEPTSEIAYLSLCTATRPYQLSRKWAEITKTFGNRVDYIITSNAGVIPLSFQTQYPFLNYNGTYHEARYNGAYPARNHNLYLRQIVSRLVRFFATHSYRYVMFNYSPLHARSMAMSASASDHLIEMGLIEDFAVLPTMEHYNAARKQKFWMSGYKMFPEIYPPMFNPVKEQIRVWLNSR